MKINRRTMIVAGALLAGVLGLIVIVPLVWPAIQYQLYSPDAQTISYKVKHPKLLGITKRGNHIPLDNRLVIPKIGVDAAIIEGSSLAILNKEEGVWHEPNTSDPVAGGNMVIAGHRFKFLPPNTTTFYNLDKVEVGDKVIVYWDHQQYSYVVYATEVVTPDHVEIRDNHGFSELTLYTCTPLWTTQQRLVVKAKPF